MSKSTEKQELAELQTFLVKRFLIVLAIVAIIEYFLMQLFNQILMPMVQDNLWDNNRLKEISGTQAIVLFILLLFRLFLIVLRGFLSESAGLLVSRGINGIESYLTSGTLEATGSEQLFYGPESNFFLLVMFLASVSILIPFALGAVWYAKIVSDQVKKIEQRRESIRQEYDRKRNLMLSDIAHDLRTPITTVAGYAKALSDGMVKEKEKEQEYLEAIERKSARMNDLIQLLFEYVKLDSEGFQLEKKKVDLAELLRKDAAFMFSDVEEAHMEFEIDIPEEIIMVDLDEIQFSRVITNLISNAIRHNEAGCRILLSLKQKAKGMQIVIADTGAPIDPELAEHLFEPFSLGDASRSSKGGSGLGLSIAYKIICMHGWELTYRSQIEGYTKGFCIDIV